MPRHPRRTNRRLGSATIEAPCRRFDTALTILVRGFVEGLVLRSQHDCDNPLCDGRVCWIWRVQVPVLVVIIDFKNDGCAFEIDRAKVVLAVGIIGGAKVVKGGDSIGQAANGFFAEGCDAGGQEDAAVVQVPPQFVVERTYPIRV